jgi:hypothetical protein
MYLGSEVLAIGSEGSIEQRRNWPYVLVILKGIRPEGLGHFSKRRFVVHELPRL